MQNVVRAGCGALDRSRSIWAFLRPVWAPALLAMFASCGGSAAKAETDVWRLRFATLAAVTVAPALAAVAEPGSPAGDGLRNYHLHLALPPALAGVIRPGESATATAPLLSRPRIPAQVLTATGSQAVLRLQFPARLIEYLTLRISFPHLSVAGVAAPIESIYAPDGRRAWIFVLREGKLRRIGVEAVGEELQTGRVLLVGDVRAGEKVAVERIDALLDGDRAEERR